MTKSQIALRKTLIKLLEKKTLIQISVKELCQEAKVSRSTFYTHYNNIDDILNEIENEIIHQLAQRNQKFTDIERTEPKDFAYFSNVMDFVREHKQEILVLTKINPDAGFIDNWKAAIKDNFRKRGLKEDGLLYEIIASEVIAAYDYYLLHNEQYNEIKIQEIIAKTLKIFEN